MSEVHFASLTDGDFADLIVAIEIAMPAASQPERLRKLQKKLMMLSRLATTESKGEE